MKNAAGQGRKPKASTIVANQQGRLSNTLKINRPPEHLDDVATAEWQRVAKLLKKAGMLDAMDGVALEIYATNYSRFLSAEEELAKRGTVIRTRTKNGTYYYQPSPYLTVSKQAQEIMMRVAGEFGLTPASRTRLPAKAVSPRKRRANDAWAKVDNADYLGALN